LGIEERFECNVFRARGRLDTLQQISQREADPWDDHRPAFDAAHAIDTFFGGCDFKDVVETKDFWFLHETLDGNFPIADYETGSGRGDSFFIGREFVEIVVVRDVFVGSLRFIDPEAGIFLCCGDGIGCDAFDFGSFDSFPGLGADRIEFAISDTGGDGAGRKDACADEIAPVEINGFGGYFITRDFIRLLHRMRWFRREDVNPIPPKREDGNVLFCAGDDHHVGIASGFADYFPSCKTGLLQGGKHFVEREEV